MLVAAITVAAPAQAAAPRCGVVASSTEYVIQDGVTSVQDYASSTCAGPGSGKVELFSKVQYLSGSSWISISPAGYDTVTTTNGNASLKTWSQFNCKGTTVTNTFRTVAYLYVDGKQIASSPAASAPGDRWKCKVS